VKIPKELIEILKSEETFIIASHINPDGDALGSSIALALALKQLQKNVYVYNRDGIPYRYTFLPCYELVTDIFCKDKVKDSIFIIVDCNEISRTGLNTNVDYKRSVVIDHHCSIKEFGDIRWVETISPATGLMIYYLLRHLGITITPEIATNLYVAIAVDTGTFRYENTTSEVLKVAAELVDLGADPGKIAINLYESWTNNRFMLLMKVLNTMEIYTYNDITVAITTITEDMFKTTNTTVADTDDFSNFPRMLNFVNISIMFREDGKGKWKASMRSKGNFNVAKIAMQFGGGGHRNAAGFITEGVIDEIKKKVIEKIKNFGNN